MVCAILFVTFMLAVFPSFSSNFGFDTKSEVESDSSSVLMEKERVGVFDLHANLLSPRPPLTSRRFSLNWPAFGVLSKNINLPPSLSLIEVIKSDNRGALKALILRGDDLNERDIRGKTPLMWTGQLSRDKMAKKLIENGAIVNFRSDNGETALMFAIKYNSVKVLDLLLQAKGDVTLVDEEGNTALLLAAKFGSARMVGMIIYAALPEGFSLFQLVNMPDGDGITPLMISLRYHDLKMAKMLIKSGADINAMHNGNNALMFAISRDNLELIGFLIANDANLDLKNLYGETVLMESVRLQDKGLIKLFIKHHANINLPDANGLTPLMMASKRGYDDIISILIESGADLLAETPQGENACMLANNVYTQGFLEEEIKKKKRCKMRISLYSCKDVLNRIIKRDGFLG